MTTLMIYSGGTAADAPGTRTGGVPLVPQGFDWPRCDECDGPMQFLAQVRLDDIDPADSGLLSIFMCQNDPGLCDEWDATAGGNRAFVFPLGQLAPSAVPSGDNVLLAETSAVAYVPMNNSEGYDEARERWCGESGRPLPDVLGQLGGAPAWLQFDETPTCAVCNLQMSFVVQLEEGHDYRTDINFGGGGCGYGFRCRPCATAAFLWQR
ncbi:DUF1963 domain-containing protein [Micromonospora soli]|uniref:DUF1963 domain-containing protein n=1 Tax=Micromonospora sp. NBRC 110009 TaxID=3061627 RepID=UPI0026725ADE|nr:DUF1963 domain-containing protein [Micromonospora sp. NBRC 110009]WKT99269.1 DUF1963 domain-containing protein [Micromonospora sp. NBRC 110009]